jgi:hypothetical protein
VTCLLEEETFAKLIQHDAVALDNTKVDRFDDALRLGERKWWTSQMPLVHSIRDHVTKGKYQVLRHRIERRQSIKVDLMA